MVELLAQKSYESQVWSGVLCQPSPTSLASWDPGKGLRAQTPWPAAVGTTIFLGRMGAWLAPTRGRCSAWGVPSISSEDAAVKGRLVECLETVLNKAQEPPKSKKVQHSNAKNAILFETISLIIHYDRWQPGAGKGGAGDLDF